MCSRKDPCQVIIVGRDLFGGLLIRRSTEASIQYPSQSHSPAFPFTEPFITVASDDQTGALGNEISLGPSQCGTSPFQTLSSQLGEIPISQRLPPPTSTSTLSAMHRSLFNGPLGDIEEVGLTPVLSICPVLILIRQCRPLCRL